MSQNKIMIWKAYDGILPIWVMLCPRNPQPYSIIMHETFQGIWKLTDEHLRKYH